jgi:predicted AlkP superfamily pyrophosphatase or phosphodiesterase
MMSNAKRVIASVQIWCCLAANVLFAHMAAGAAPMANADRVVVMISVDGLAAFYWDDENAEMPTLRALAAGGALGRMKASAPTVTWPNHATLVTGVTPSRHGVVGNNYYDRKNRRPVALISDPDFDQEQIVKVPTIYDLAKRKGLQTAAVRWPASRNAKSLDWTFPDVASNEILRKYTTSALLNECLAAGLWEDGEVVDAGRPNVQIVSDPMCARVFDFILRNHRPQLALLHLIHVDHVQHLSGPRSPEAYAAIKMADEQVRSIWEFLKKEYPDRATLVIVSDHGFSPTEHLIFPNVILRDAGLVEVKDKKATGGALHVIVQGGAAMVYVIDEDRRETTIDRVSALFDGSEGIWKVVGPGQLKDHGIAQPKEDPNAPDMVLFAKDGYSFSESAAGTAAILERPERKGNHGHDENLPSMFATFAAWGTGIRSGVQLGEIRNTDVAPTIARLLGLAMPEVEGKPLTAALTD